MKGNKGGVKGRKPRKQGRGGGGKQRKQGRVGVGGEKQQIQVLRNTETEDFKWQLTVAVLIH